VDESTNVDWISRRGKTLVVRFKNGGRYEYDDVSSAVVDRILSADSVGRAVHAELVKTKWPCRRGTPDAELDPMGPLVGQTMDLTLIVRARVSERSADGQKFKLELEGDRVLWVDASEIGLG